MKIENWKNFTLDLHLDFFRLDFSSLFKEFMDQKYCEAFKKHKYIMNSIQWND